jgi:hypothetical protein
VRSLFWAHGDSGIVSAGMDGAVYQWDLEESKREGEYVLKGISTNWICATSAFEYNLPGNRAAYMIHLFGIDLFYFDFDLSCMTICVHLTSVFISIVAA